MAVGAPGSDARLREVRRWRTATVPGPSLGKRAEQVYTVLLTCAIFGVGLVDTVHTALSEVISVDGGATWGPAAVLIALVVVARWGAYQGPVVYAVADVAHLLGAPLSRRELAARRLASRFVAGAVAGALVGGLAATGLAGNGPGISGARAVGLIVAAAAVGVIAVAGAWAVQTSATVERVLGPATWLALAAGIALGLLGHRHPGVIRVERWSGPWGWASAPVRGPAWPLAVVLVWVAAAGAVALVLSRCGHCPTDRHLRRAEARAGAAASLAGFDARSTRKALQGGAARKAPRGTGTLRWGGRGSVRSLLAWRGATALRRTPARVAEALVVGGAASALLLVSADRVTAALGGGLLLYVAATRLLEPLREEVDVPGRARILLPDRWGAILFAHTMLPAVLLALGVALGLAVCLAASAVAAPGGALAACALLGVPVATLAAALSARRGGRLPTSVLSFATSSDTAGTGGLLVVGWLLMWPLIGALGAGLPVALVASGGIGSLEPAIILSVLVTAVLSTVLRRSATP